ncbi:hypothetical protein E9549_19500 [Blastococcus sp. MG754426]|uniref:hypothetical protein n=1 Tax=unclassified Blastococcus TaxID=2619396 RepID=UPI001EF09548|nr:MULTISPECIES: hypothetical protein [unclassified Blastococcus]MCF6509563.1 hypothetical protein [Blastococcus sp. MG754426]MCF6513742.1 hypothetical protein [Blastococcus sp. MG754427]
MSSVELDLRRLGPAEAPLRSQLEPVATADRLLVRGPVAGLSGALAALFKAGRTAEVPVAWEPAADKSSTALARALGIGTGAPRELGLVRDDHGGVLLHHGRIEASGDGRRSLSRRLGLQAYHDDIKVADGEITRIDVRPDWTAVDTITVTVMTQPLRPTRQTSGRALQVASDPARIVRDGVPFVRPVHRWTWYADDRVRWRLDP